MGATMEMRNKFNARPLVHDGIRFASHAEAKRYFQLCFLRKIGALDELVVHPAFDLHVSGHRIGRYVADFSYRRDGRIVVEDVKSRPTMTALYRWKKRHLKAELGLEVTEVF